MGDVRHLPPPSTARNSSAQTSALVFNGLFLLPGGGHLPLPSAAALLPCAGRVLRCTGCWHLALPLHPGNRGVWSSVSRVRGWLAGKLRSLLPSIASLPAAGSDTAPRDVGLALGTPGCGRLWDAGGDEVPSPG